MKKNQNQKKITKIEIKKESKWLLIPKFLAVILVLALYLFVGEFFSPDLQWSHFMLAIVPGSIYLAISCIAWRNARIGGALFVILGLGLVLLGLMQGRNILGNYVLALATFLLGFLFIYFRRKVAQ
ncbi:MAG: hypothetical protein COX30_03020 [Candidatus Moranbacteria bacterium CG23_combo_of_CG06-09_8_20_14_all_39_10]|nr:MAG: hypothetical protein COX30_03020 [Candidatus Moranbacteria bacterium CG23_combo_of_CG06-09_8_20_14_all_39_10]